MHVCGTTITEIKEEKRKERVEQTNQYRHTHSHSNSHTHTHTHTHTHSQLVVLICEVATDKIEIRIIFEMRENDRTYTST